jgi:hypothetical protein
LVIQFLICRPWAASCVNTLGAGVHCHRATPTMGGVYIYEKAMWQKWVGTATLHRKHNAHSVLVVTAGTKASGPHTPTCTTQHEFASTIPVIRWSFYRTAQRSTAMLPSYGDTNTRYADTLFLKNTDTVIHNVYYK